MSNASTATPDGGGETVLVVAPHPDDETLGCGGTLLRHRAEGDAVHWLIVTGISEEAGFAAEQVEQRAREIERVSDAYGVTETHELGFPTTRLDVVSQGDLVDGIGAVVRRVEPEVVYLPHRHDAHTDHAAVFDAVSACTKWFRYPSVRRALAYETLSETEFALRPSGAFRANVFTDISGHLDRKCEIMMFYASEMGDFPFPRSEEALRACARLRGATAGCEAAEAFMLLRERR